MHIINVRIKDESVIEYGIDGVRKKIVIEKRMNTKNKLLLLLSEMAYLSRRIPSMEINIAVTVETKDRFINIIGVGESKLYNKTKYEVNVDTNFIRRVHQELLEDSIREVIEIYEKTTNFINEFFEEAVKEMLTNMIYYIGDILKEKECKEEGE